MTTENQLLPCPFCGEEPHDARHIEYGRWAVTCQCGVHGASASTGPNATDELKIKAYNDARAAWNRRAALTQPMESPLETVARLGFKLALDDEMQRRADEISGALHGGRVNYQVEQDAAKLIWEMSSVLATRSHQKPAEGGEALPSSVEAALRHYAAKNIEWVTFAQAERETQLARLQSSEDWQRIEDDGRGHEQFVVTTAKAEAALEDLLNWQQRRTTPPASQEQAQQPDFNGWYCAHCQRGVDSSDVTFHEQHTVCGRVITNDRPPVQQPSGGEVVLPAGWVPLTIEHEPGYSEEVAFGPQRMMDRLKKWLDKHFATLATKPEPMTWQPIETAPKDGTEFLGWRHGRIATARLVPRDDCEMWCFGGESFAFESFPALRPTHWMPLPDAPGITSTKEPQR